MPSPAPTEASRDLVVFSLDGSRSVKEYLEEDQPATAPLTLPLHVSAYHCHVSEYHTAVFHSALHHTKRAQLRAIKEAEESRHHRQAILLIRST